MRGLRDEMALTSLIWSIGSRIPRRIADGLARIAAPLVAAFPLPALANWEESAHRAVGRPMTRTDRVKLVETWIRNSTWSLSLGRWSDEEILDVVDIEECDVNKLRESLAGPGLVLALPHMGSWDFAGAWCARMGIKVVSVAERLPDGLYEKFRDARSEMGMDIYPVDEPNLMTVLTAEIRAGHTVCLLSDRDLSQRGIEVTWPDAGIVSVPAGPALLAARTGADLRVAAAYFVGDRLRLTVSDPVVGQGARGLMQGVVVHFAEAVRSSPSNWLMLRKFFR